MTALQKSDNLSLAGRIERLADEWRLPVAWIAAACRAAGIPCESPPREVDASVAALAEELLAWQRDHLSFVPGSPAPLSGPPELRLRELFRAIYCDVGDPRHILMLLAAHHLRLFGPTAGPELAQEMLRVYVPVAEMLGIYHVRRAWIEQCTRILREEEYFEQADKMKIPLDEPTSEGIEDAVCRRQAALSLSTTGEEASSASILPLSVDDRSQLFTRLRGRIKDALRHKWGEARWPNVELVPELPGHVLYYSDKDRSADSPHLIVRVTCRTRDDCYRVLGIIHDAFPPVGSGQGSALRDYIGSPRINGYRALQTVCLWTHPVANDRHLSRVVSFRIMTDEMRRLNEWGVLTENVPQLATDGRSGAWWKRLNRSSRGLMKRSEEQAGDIAAYLRRNPPDGPGDPIYCFTPIGEIFWLEEGETALDFAIRIHSELVPHTAQIFVNGADVSFNTPLTNGALVRVEHDLSRSRVDICWLNQVKSARSRAKIRAALRRRAERIHPGYWKFEESLIRRMDQYAAGGDAPAYQVPDCDNNAVDLFLWRAALDFYDGEQEALYSQMAERHGTAIKLAHRFISERVVADIETSDGRALPGPLRNIYVCPNCRPSPAMEEIEGRLSRETTLTIHRRGCAYVSRRSPAIELRWGAEEDPDTWPLYRFEINTPDSAGLLSRVLKLVYDLPHAYLFSSKAEVTEQRRADIDLLVAVRLPQLCRDLWRQIAKLAPDTQVKYEFSTHNRRGKVRMVDMSRELANPFTESEVTDWRFIGRDDILQDIHGWIQGHPFRSHLLMLHGQPRVGKTSLIWRLVTQKLVEDLGRAVVPVLVDFRPVALDRPDTVAESLVQRIFPAIDAPIPRLEPHEDPLIWLDRHLSDAARRLGDRRLLVIIDEFDADFAELIKQKKHSAALRGLRAVIDSHPDIRWILVVQSIYLLDPQLRAALPDLPVDVPRIAVRHLPRPIARRLVIDLSSRGGNAFSPNSDRHEDLPDQIVNLTAGNAYLIHIFGRSLLQRLSHGRRHLITPQDLAQAIDEMLGRRSLFEPLFLSLSADQQAIVRFIADAVPPGGSLPLDALPRVLAERVGLDEAGVPAQIYLLDQIDVLRIAGGMEDRQVSIPIQLLHRWLRPD